MLYNILDLINAWWLLATSDVVRLIKVVLFIIIVPSVEAYNAWRLKPGH